MITQPSTVNSSFSGIMEWFGRPAGSSSIKPINTKDPNALARIKPYARRALLPDTEAEAAQSMPGSLRRIEGKTDAELFDQRLTWKSGTSFLRRKFRCPACFFSSSSNTRLRTRMRFVLLAGILSLAFGLALACSVTGSWNSYTSSSAFQVNSTLLFNSTSGIVSYVQALSWAHGVCTSTVTSMQGKWTVSGSGQNSLGMLALH
jgi:hypothetical protein